MVAFYFEDGVYSPNPLLDEVRRRGLPVVSEMDTQTFFYGSMELASKLAKFSGCFCDDASLRVSSWSKRIPPVYLLNPEGEFMTALEFSRTQGECFVRPDSSLKPFSGRVVSRPSLEAIDYGFYFDDPNLPVYVTSTKEVGSEYRCVIMGEVVVDLGNRLDGSYSEEVSMFSTEIAKLRPCYDWGYVLDVALHQGRYKVVELNPLSASELRMCNPSKIINALTERKSEWIGL